MILLVDPQLGKGALRQFPVRRTGRVRTVMNQAADGSTVRLADPAGEITEWQLEYAEITDDEAAALETFFTAAGGALQGFTFLDPSANLLAWGDALTTDSWQADSLLDGTSGGAHPGRRPPACALH